MPYALPMQPDQLWPSQRAKAHFSLLLRLTQLHPQTILYHGQKHAVLVRYDLFLKLARTFSDAQKTAKNRSDQTAFGEKTMK